MEGGKNMSLLELHFQKKATIILDFSKPIPQISPEEIDNLMTQTEFNQLWLQLKASSENDQKKKLWYIFGISLAIFGAILIITLLSLFNIIGGKYPIMALFILYSVILGTKWILQMRRGSDIRVETIAKINNIQLQPKGLRLIIRNEEIEDYKSQTTATKRYLDLVVQKERPESKIA